MADYNQTQFAAAVLQRLGIPQSRGALQALVGWEQAEGGHWKNSAKYNPLNTTLNLPGSGDTGSQGNISVYRDWNQGIEATAKTLENGRYGGILQALKAGNPSAAARAIQASPWGTSGGLVIRTIAGAKVPGSVNVPGAFSSAAAGNTAPAAVGPSGSGQQAAPNFSDPGQSGDFTGLLGQLLGGHQQQAPQSQAVAPPQFSAMAPMPKGFMAATPNAGQAPAAQSDRVGGALSLIEGLRGTDPASNAQSGADATGGAPEPVAVTVANQRAAMKAGEAPTFAPGTTKFEGKVVAAWIAPALQYARDHGWQGTVNSGYRSFAEQRRIYNSGVRPAAKPGTSNHEGDEFPRGAVDVSDAATLSRILRNSPYAKQLIWAGSKDPVHFSHPHNGSY